MNFIKNGVQITTAQDALTRAQAIFIATYGSNIDLHPSSPTGLLIQQIANIIMERDSNITSLYASINPYLAFGIELDALCSNLGIYRIPATSTVADVTVTGISGTVIPANKQVISTNQDIFLIAADITIDSNGNGTGQVVAKESGVVPAISNTINSILQGVNGWDTITNPIAGTIGKVQESDYSLRNRFLDSQAASASSSILALRAAFSILETPFTLLENKTDTAVTISGVEILPHSVGLWIVGATDEQIAAVFFNKLSGGCNMTGATSYDYPIPNTSPIQYFVAKFNRPTPAEFILNITLSLGYLYSPTIQDDILEIINANWKYTNPQKTIFASSFIKMLESNGIQPITKLTITSGTNVAVNKLTLPISEYIVTPLVLSNINVEVV